MSTYFEAVLTIGVLGAAAVAVYQIWRMRREAEHRRRIEADSRYVEFLKQALSSETERIPMGYDPSLLQHYVARGGTRKELLLYDLLFSCWENGYLLYHDGPADRWQRWSDWIRMFFVTNQRCAAAWDLAGRYFDEGFVAFVEQDVLKSMDERADYDFPDSIEEWRKLPAVYSGDTLMIGPFEVMQAWERPLMDALADEVTAKGGDVLEVGFGMAISAERIQQGEISSHTIVEAHPGVYERLAEWAQNRPNVRPVSASWEEWAHTAAPASFDAILFDTFPIRRSELHKNHFPFFSEAARLLKPGGIFTYYTDEATHVCPEHQEILMQFFARFRVEKIEVTPPENCQYWTAKQMLMIVAEQGH